MKKKKVGGCCLIAGWVQHSLWGVPLVHLSLHPGLTIPATQGNWTLWLFLIEKVYSVQLLPKTSQTLLEDNWVPDFPGRGLCPCGNKAPPQSGQGEGNGTPLQYSCLENPMDGEAWWAAVHGVAKIRTWLSDFTFTFHFHVLEKEMETHPSVLAWRIPGTGEPGGLPSMGSHRVGHDWSDLAVAAGWSGYPPCAFLLTLLSWPCQQQERPGSRGAGTTSCLGTWDLGYFGFSRQEVLFLTCVQSTN